MVQLVVDLVYLQTFEMDTTTWEATIGGGTLLGDVTTRLHDAGGRRYWRTCYHRWLRSSFTSMGYQPRTTFVKLKLC